jgi:hypothetical protein
VHVVIGDLRPGLPGKDKLVDPVAIAASKDAHVIVDEVDQPG